MSSNKKNALQEYAVKNGMAAPRYQSESTGEAHAPVWRSCVWVGELKASGGISRSKTDAEISAASAMLESLCENTMTILIDYDTHEHVFQDIVRRGASKAKIVLFTTKPSTPTFPSLESKLAQYIMCPCATHVSMGIYLGMELTGSSSVIAVAASYGPSLVYTVDALLGTKKIHAINSWNDLPKKW